MKNRFLLPGFLIAVLIVLPGCKTPDFLGHRFDNFTAYYNTFYNAKRVYDKGYKNLYKSTVSVDRLKFLPIYERTTGAGSREFENAVLKSAELLRRHPDSKWVDDALLLIGKSYFYQENFVGATQKFREVVHLKSGLEDEGLFWLVRSLTTSGTLDLAEEELLAVLDREEPSKKWNPQYRLLLGELKVQQQVFNNAIPYLEGAIPSLKNKAVAGRAQFLLGQVLEQQERFEEAVFAYENVRRFTPVYELDYAARYSAVRVKGKYLDPDQALQDLRRMERDDKNFSNLSELHLLKARIWQDVGRDDESFDLYTRLLYEPDPRNNATNLRGRIHYALGELYRDIDVDFVMAAAHFDTASVTLGTSSNARSKIRSGISTSSRNPYAPEAITDATELKISFSRFARVYREMARYDSLMWLGAMPDDEFDEKILEFRRVRAEELARQQRRIEERQRDQAFASGANASDPFLNRGLPKGKIIPGMNDGRASTAGFLFHRDPIRVQEGRLTFQEVWGNRPLAPNWRRNSALTSVIAERDTETDIELQAALESYSEETLPDIDISAIPRDSTKWVEMDAARAISRYELGNTLFLAMSLPDSAAVWYRRVVDENADQPVAQRALYALAEVQRALGDSVSAQRIYRDILIRFPDSDFSADVRRRLGMEVGEVAATDSMQMAIEAYELANASVVEGETVVAINKYLQVAADWIGYDESARALLAAAQEHMRGAGSDSTAIFAPLQVSVETKSMMMLWPDKFKIARPDSMINQIGEGYGVREELFVEDLYALVATDYRRTRFGVRAEAVQIALDELRTPPPDSTSAVSDSVLVARREDGAPIAVFALPSDSTLFENGAIEESDSLLVIPGQQSPVLPGARPSEKIISDSTRVDPDIDRFEAQDKPAFAPDPEEENLTRSSSNIKPLLPTGKPDLDAVGWTWMIGNHIRFVDAQAQLLEWTDKLESTGIRLYILTNSAGERYEFIVGWGIFESRSAGDEAAAKFGDVLPERRNYLNLLPTTVRRR